MQESAHSAPALAVLSAPNPARYARYAWFVLAYNLFVILWGAYVRATGSGAGCGSHWPLCNGEIVPRSPAVETLVEFGHRLTSGIDLILVALLVAGAWRTFPSGHRVRLWAGLSGVFLVTEALIGAGLVLLEHVASDTSPERGLWVSGHLVNTFTLLAALTLTAWCAARPAGRLAFRGGVTTAFLALSLLGMLVLGVSGALTALGDTLFPVSSFEEGKAQTFSKTAHLFVRLRIWHPALALAVGGLLLASAYGVLRGAIAGPARRLAAGLIPVYAVQLGFGLLNMWFLAPVWMQIVHLLLADAIWILLVLLASTWMFHESSRTDPIFDPR